MRNLLRRGYVKLHDRRLRPLREDEAGLSLLAYALGAAFIVVPLGIVMFVFGSDAANKATNDVASLVDGAP